MPYGFNEDKSKFNLNDLVSRITDLISTLATVATSGSYNDLSDKPTTMTPSSHTHTKSEITDFSHTHGKITNAGDITTNVAIASGDRLVINDESASQLNNSSITFGSSTTTYLTNKGTWATPAGTGLTKTLLWTNSAITSNFTAQSISLAVQNYKFLLFVSKDSPSSGAGNHYDLIPYDTAYTHHIYAGRLRQVTLASGKVTFSHANGSQGYQEGYNDSCIPYKIYGIN